MEAAESVEQRYGSRWPKPPENRKSRKGQIKRGRANEKRVLLALLRAKGKDGEPIFLKVVLHEPLSPEDKSGVDFTVSIYKNGEVKTLDVGITSDFMLYQSRKLKGRVELHIKPSHSERTIVEKFLELFESHFPPGS